MSLALIHFYTQIAMIVAVTIVKRKQIWKAMCGGNGIPQINEFMQYAMGYFSLFYISEIMWLNKEPNILVLGFLFAYGSKGDIKLPSINLNKSKKPDEKS